MVSFTQVQQVQSLNKKDEDRCRLLIDKYNLVVSTQYFHSEKFKQSMGKNLFLKLDDDYQKLESF